MEQDKFILATDYKHSLFSAIFAFEAKESVFLKMDKQDLLHSYMVCKILLSFVDAEQEPSIFAEPFFETARTMVKNVVLSIRKQVGMGFEKRMRESLKRIEKDFPVETKRILEIIDDEERIVAATFFIPQVLHQLFQEFEEHQSKKTPNLVVVSLDQLTWSANNSPIYATLMDIADCWRSWDNKVINKKKAAMAEKNTRDNIKEIVQLHLGITGEFDRYVKNKRANSKKEGEAPQEPAS